MTPDLRALTPADRHQVLVALTAVVDRELAAVVTTADTHWRDCGFPLEIRAMLCDLLTWSLADVRADAYAFVQGAAGADTRPLMADVLVPMRVLVNGWGVDDYHVAGEVIDVPILYVETFELCGYARRVAAVSDAETETPAVRRNRRQRR